MKVSRSAADKAWMKIFADDGTPEILSLFRQLFSESDPTLNYDFTTLHRIVLKLDQKDLKTHLQTCSQADINQRDASGFTPLLWAAMRGDSEAVEILLLLGADASISSFHGAQALHYASRRSDLRSIDLLLKYGGDPNARDRFEFTPLVGMFSASWSNVDVNCIKRLVDGGAMIDVRGSQGATALIFAAQYGDVLALETLLTHGAKINISSLDGETALTVAVQMNAHSAISHLLAHGASLTQHTVSGRSLLHEAAERGDQETLRLLTSARIRGVKINHKNSSGTTAWDLARQRNDVMPEWRAAFVDLIESVDEIMPEPPPISFKEISKGSFLPRIRLSSMVRVFEDRIWQGAERVCELANRLPQLRVRTLFALLIACLAFLWYAIRS